MNIRARIKNKSKDNFFVFPESLKNAFKILGKTKKDIDKIIKLQNIRFVTFKNSNEYIEVKK